MIYLLIFLTVVVICLCTSTVVLFSLINEVAKQAVGYDDYDYKRLIKESSDPYYGHGRSTPTVVILVDKVRELERTVKDLPSFKAKVAKEKLEEAKAIMDSIKGDE